MQRIAHLPLIVILSGIAGIVMTVPAIHAFVMRDYFLSRTFFYSGALVVMLSTLVGIALSNRPREAGPRDQLLNLVAAFTLLPVVLALPFEEGVRTTTFSGAWWEMVSSFTTTGASIYDPAKLGEPLHLWRALVGWLGGFFMLCAAAGILAPMNLGGYEVIAGTTSGQGALFGGEALRERDANIRVGQAAALLFPVYAGLTLLLWIGLIMAGDRPFVAACHAMSTLATSGISPVGGLKGAHSGVLGEVFILLLLVFALSRQLFPAGRTLRQRAPLAEDPELRMAALILLVVPLMLFMRHWVGALEADDVQDGAAALGALWGTVFTVMSFLTTTGFESIDWAAARTWSLLSTPGLILAGLTVIGGGVATTAGGVKLLRVYALFRHGEREIERLVHPHSVGGSGQQARRLRRQGAMMAWILFMLSALSICVVMLALSLTGLDFVASTVFAVAALSTTGPLAAVAAELPLRWADLGVAAQAISAVAMVLGRLETLAIIALLNPEFWRK